MHQIPNCRGVQFHFLTAIAPRHRLALI